MYYMRPVIPLLLSLMSGLIAGQIQGHAPMAFAVFLAAYATIIRCMVRKKTSYLSPLLLFAAAGYLLLQPPHDMVQRLSSTGHILSYAGKGDMTVSGLVETEPEVGKRDQKFILAGLSVEDAQGRPARVQGKVKATVSLDCQRFTKGDTLTIRSKIKALRNFYNPQGFDYEQFMARQDVWASVYGKNGRVALVKAGKPSALDRMRNAVELLIHRSRTSEPGKEVLKALLTGSRQGIPPEVQNDFNRTGTAHLLSISGLHVGIVAGFSFMVLNILLSFFPQLLWQARVKALAGILALIPVWTYGFLAGMPPGTQRAVIMATVFLLTYGFQAEHEIINTLCIAAMVILALSPTSLFHISFQLSFASVLLIVWGMKAMGKDSDGEQDREENWPGAIFRYFKTCITVSFLAFAGTWPLVAYYFNQVSVIGLVANTVLVPLVGVCVVVLGMSAVFICPFWSWPAGWIITTAGLILDQSIRLMHFFASFSWASFHVVTPSRFELVCYYILLIAFLAMKTHGDSLRNYRKTMYALAGLVFLMIISDGVYWIKQRYYHDDLRITYMDVGQGNASLVEFPMGRCMLIDGGGFSDNETFDVGEKLVAPFLWSKKIARVDTVVLTHPESDHLNGLIYVLEHFKVAELWTNGEEKHTKGFRKLMDVARLKHVTVRPRNTLPDDHELGGVGLKVFWPCQTAESYAYTAKNSNNTSLVIRLSFGKQSFLFPGDIMAGVEEQVVQLTKGRNDLQSTVLLIPHHGSKTSSSDIFLEAVHPQHAVISAGYKNWYKMPHPQVVHRLNSLGATLYRTDLNGAVLMSTRGGSLEIRTVIKPGDTG